MQYFIRAAHALGMEDGPTGVRLDSSKSLDLSATYSPAESLPGQPIPTQISGQMEPHRMVPTERQPSSNVSHSTGGGNDSGSSLRSDSMMSADSFETTGTRDSTSSMIPGKFFSGLVPLTLPEDRQALSPLRCFLREQVCAFSATEDDIAVEEKNL